MSGSLTVEEKKQRLTAKNKLASATVLMIVEDEFACLYLRNIFNEILELQNTVECSTPDEAKKYLEEQAGKNLSCVVCSMYFKDGSTGADFLRFIRSSTYSSVVVPPFLLMGDNTDAAVQYAFLVKHFAGHISQSFTPSEFIHTLLEVFSVRDRRRDQRELAKGSKSNRSFNRLFEGD